MSCSAAHYELHIIIAAQIIAINYLIDTSITNKQYDVVHRATGIVSYITFILAINIFEYTSTDAFVSQAGIIYIVAESIHMWVFIGKKLPSGWFHNIVETQTPAHWYFIIASIKVWLAAFVFVICVVHSEYFAGTLGFMSFCISIIYIIKTYIVT